MKITVITCTFNAEQTLKRTLQSVRNQDYQSVEHLIIDGCSKDQTLRLAEEYKALSDEERHGHEVKILSEPDRGLYDAMNKGLRLATGDYLVYLNAGDTFGGDDTLTRVAAMAEDGKRLPGVIYGDTDVVDDEGRFVRHRRLKPTENLKWTDFQNGMIVCHQAFYVLVSLARAIPYNIYYRYSADVDWCIRIMKQSADEQRPLVYCHHVVAHYLEGGMSVKNHRASLKERFKIMAKHYGLFPTLLRHVWFVVRAIAKR